MKSNAIQHITLIYSINTSRYDLVAIGIFRDIKIANFQCFPGFNEFYNLCKFTF